MRGEREAGIGPASMTLLAVLCCAAGGAVGAPVRFLADRALTRRIVTELPIGTLLVNLSGSLLLGLVSGLGLHGHLSGTVEDVLGTGFCGAYTTFSTWSYETVRLLEEGEILEAAIYTGLSVLVGLAAAGAGLAIGLAVS